MKSKKKLKKRIIELEKRVEELENAPRQIVLPSYPYPNNDDKYWWQKQWEHPTPIIVTDNKTTPINPTKTFHEGN